MIQLEHIDGRINDLHPLFAGWWEGHGFPVVPVEALKTMGLMATIDGVPAAVAFVYTASECSLAMLEWMTTDPKISPMQALRCVDALVDFAASEAKARGYGVLFTTCRQKALGRVYKKNGFQLTDENVSHYLKPL